MKRSHSLNWLFLALCLFTLALLAYPTVVTSAERNGIEAAWERAREAGAYRFTAGIVQTTIPLPTVTNVGRQSRQNALHIEGRTSLPERSLDLTLWSEGGSVLNAASGIEVRVEDDRAFARRGAGSWEEINDFTGIFAPEGDFMAYLAAARDVVEHAPETRAGITFTRYTFRIDGRSYAAYLRDQLERHLAEKGELPSGVELHLPRQYAGMTGEGELWVSEDGLPLRQILHLAFPETDDDRVEAEIRVDFSDFGSGDNETLEVFRDFQSLACLPSRRTLQQAAFFATTMALIVVMVAYRRSRKLYAALVLAISASMIVTPLLQSAHAARFAERQAARAQEQEQRAQESEMMRELRELQTESDFNPHADPLASQRVSESASRPFAHSPIRSLADSSADFDSDGLTDYQEELLGTDPYYADSDGYLLSDTLEVQGFEYAGQTWYLDPLELDTNRDGIDDGREWFLDQDENGLPDDTDGNGVPDLFDRDNDGDGVPDDLDLSPYETTRDQTPFSADAPFSLIVDNLTPDKPTYVEFQLRPTNPDHLWYAFNVLDWPDGDRQGQIQDDDGDTFADVLDNASPSDENGDLKLLPMLEIRITGPYDNLPPTSTLENHYGIYIQHFQGDGAEKAVYVPLQLATEDDSGARVAFYGKMLYQPDESWGDAQQVRLVWAVQALVDECDSYSLGDTDGDGEDDFSKECQSYGEHNEVQVVHTYDDEWYLTGLNVRENHEVDVGVIYEDPAPGVDDDLDDDSVLVKLTYGLDHTFLAARDLDEDGQRDITVAELYRRFNHTTNASVPITPTRWGISNTLAVTIATYTHQDEALMTIAMTTTPAVLDEFTPYVPVSPTLLFVREEHYRATNLDAGGDDGAFTWDGSGRQLTVDMDPDSLPVQTAAAVLWAPYRYRDGEWESYPIEEYWDELGRRYEDDFDDVSDPTEAQGMLVYIQIYYMGLYAGLTTVVQSGDVPYSTELAAPQLSDDAVLTRRIFGGARSGAKFLTNILVQNLVVDAKPVFLYLGKLGTSLENVGDVNPALVKSLKYLKEEFQQWRLRRGGIGQGMNKVHVAAGLVALVAVVMLIAGVAFLIADHFNNSVGLRIAGLVLVGTVIFCLQVVVPLIAVVRLIRGAMSTGLSIVRATSSVLRGSADLIGITRVANIVGLVLMVGIVWGFFIYRMAQGGAGFLSIQFNMLLARAIADTIFALILFALSCTIIGAIIVAIYIMVDLLLYFITGFSTTDWIADKIAQAIYDYEVMVEAEIDSGRLGMELVNPQLGMVEGSLMAVTMAITTTVTHKNPDDWRAKAYLWKYSENNIRSTTFEHVMASSAYSVTVSRNEMRDDWDVSHDHTYWKHSMRRAEAKVNLVENVPLEAGVNTDLSLYINTGFALPALSCWTLYIPLYGYFIPVCTNKTIDGSEETSIGESIVLDVWPDTLDEFYALDWGDFDVQRDHDGDGLISAAAGGNDPDDTTWDSDGDGLSDAYELTRRSMSDPGGGVRPSALNEDTDGDGLCDGDEIRWGTLPQRRDSDGDGLQDGEEVFHQHCTTGEWIGGWTYSFVYTATTGITQTMAISVTSDPLNANTDGDALDDLAERTLGEHPRVWTDSPVVVRTEHSDDDGFVAPGDTFAFTATVESQIEHDPPLFFLGGMTVTPASLLNGYVQTATFNLYQGEAVSLTQVLTVAGGASSGELPIHTEMAGDMHDGDLDTYWSWDDPQPAQDIISTADDPGYARIAASLNLANGLYAVASVEGDDDVHLRHAEAVFSAETEVRSDSRCGRGVGEFPPGVACADDGTCIVAWGNTHDHSCTWVYLDEFYCHDDSDVGDHAEFDIFFDGDKVGHWGGVDTGEWHSIDETYSYCDSGKIKVYETDTWPNPDDYMGSHTIGYCGGSGNHYFEEEDGDAAIRVYYDIHSAERDGIYGRTVDENRTAQGDQFGVSDQGGGERWRPAAASDGTGFLVGWQERKFVYSTWEWAIYVQQVSDDGALGDESRLDVSPSAKDDTNPALAWVGDKYMAVWEHSSGDGQDVWMAYVDEDGDYVNGSRRTLAGSPGDETHPQVAYNPQTDRALVVYNYDGSSIRGRFVQDSTIGDEFVIATQGSDTASPAATYEPKYDHWLVSWDEGNTVNYVPLSAGGEVLLDKQGLGPGATHDPLYESVSFTDLNNHDLACSTEVGGKDYAQCAIVAANDDDLFLQPLYMEDVSPFLGSIEIVTDTVMLVDADVPTSTIVSLSDGQYLAATGTLIIGGDAGDTPSGIAGVEISLDGGATWTDTTGAESWAYAWEVPETDGPVTLQTRATDLVGNVENPPTEITVHLDRTPPTVNIPDPGIVSATQNAEERWQVGLAGTVSDAAGSGVVSVEALLTPDGRNWQTATLGIGTWSLDYVLPEFGAGGRSLVNPTGVYSTLVRATDGVGNLAETVSRTLQVDATPPEASLTDTGPSTTTITTTLTVGGVITDVGSVAIGVQSLDISFTPAGEDPSTWGDATVLNPGATTSDWSRAVPSGLEGVYEIDLRGSDMLGNRNDDTSTWQAWQGEIDTRDPRAVITMTYRGAGSAAQTVYEGWAEDFNLTEDGFQFPCPLQAADREYYDDVWWNEVTSGTQRLYRLTPACIVNGFQTGAATLRACDVYSHCTTVTDGPPSGYVSPALASTVLTPSHESLLGSTAPVSITGGAYALNELRALTVTVNGALLYTQTWSSPTDTQWDTTWTPPGEGSYNFLTEVEDNPGNVQTESQPISITVDTQDPSITIATTVLTTAHRLSFGRVPLTGTVTDTVGLDTVEVRVDSGDWGEAAFDLDEETWRYLWYLGEEPDGDTYSVSARATDAAGHTGQATRTVTVDLTEPEPVTVTLAYTGTLGVRQPLTPGQTIRKAPVTLIAEWTASSSSDLSRYYVGWTESTTAELSALTTYVPAAPRHHTQLAGEPQARYAHVVSVDTRGNRQTQTLGPVYVDTPLTPDYVGQVGNLSYHGWMESGCTQIGADREAARNAYTGASLDEVQKMYTSWDTGTLRITWVGADWNAEGDLFVYLDTTAGGATTAYDPYGSGPAISLPGLAADYLILVEDGNTASLMQWSGGWSAVSSDMQYQLDLGLLPPHTDIAVPFADLGSPTTLKLVALASEENALRVWAAMPDKNPLNSGRVVDGVALGFLNLPFTLTQQYEWTALGSGQCPNAGLFADADLRVSLTADPAGVELGFLQHDLPGLLIPGQPLDDDLDGDLDMTLPVDVQPALLGDDQPVTYTLVYTNAGVVVAPGAVVTLTARGGVELAGGSPRVIALNQVSGTVQIAATVNVALDGQSAEVDGVVADATHGEFDWLWVQHDVDTEPPTDLAIEAPAVYANAYTNTILGSVADPSGVPTITLEVREVGTGITTTLVCTDPTPFDGLWDCLWNAGGAADGTQFELRARATDRFGNGTPGWTAPHTVTVDATPPTVTLSADTEDALSDDLMGLDEIGLTGQVHDDREAAQVEVCAAPPGETEQDCSLFDVLLSITPTVANWYAPAPISGDEDGAWRIFYFYGLDSVGNRSLTPVTRTVQVDVVAPAVTVTTALSGVLQATLSTVLTGTVSDGHIVEPLPPDTQLYVAKPDNTAEWYPLSFHSDDWSCPTIFSDTGNYQLGLEFRDEAGNLQQAGPFGLTVYESDQVASLSLERSVSSDPAITDRPLTYTFTIHNHGPSVTTPTLTISLPTPVSLLWTSHDCTGTLVCEPGALNSGASITVEVRVHVPLTTTGKLVCWAVVESGKVDLNLSDNQTEPLYTPVVQPISGLYATTDSPTRLRQITTLSATIGSGTDILFDWNLGDDEMAWGLGGYEVGPTWVVTHEYPATGVYVTVVTATNSLNVLTATVVVTITALPVGGYTEPARPLASSWLWIMLIAAAGLAALVTVALRKLSDHIGG